MKNKEKVNHHLDKTNNKRKKIIIIIVLIILAILIYFFVNMYYKNKNLGNNMSNKNIEDIEEYILNISSYQAKIEVEVESNKNSNKYVLEQVYKKDSYSKQTVLQPSNIEGMEIIYENNTLKLNYTKLNLTSVYENYQDLVDNFLWIDSFIEDYKNSKNNNEATITEENEMIIMKAKARNSNNQYVYYKELTIDKKTGKPTKLLIQDINQKSLVYILYNEITVNGLQ